MARGRPRQQAFLWKTRGGARQGAGRQPAPQNVGLLAHVARPDFLPRLPVHVTMRALRGVPNMRAQAVAPVVIRVIGRTSEKGLRILHFWVQKDHLHLIVEADDAESLSRGMQRLASRVAMAVNALMGRRGRFWKERYHRRDLGTPRQFRNALVYVTMNFRKHGAAAGGRTLDGMSSAVWLDDWKEEAFADFVREQRVRAGPRNTAEPETWIARVGWKRHGRLDPLESPRSPG